eukprot:CAMPEP_0194114804 /NCGR_PEP_ID=MMETSP0150-20130528/21520_1 /TAXON_ID=122233 /ORGANISM="Chaetoceros debilis, Strain MM31A-1" /LENGTH=277 /DNA_ID=CAMNT_0038805111 /DNA_START=166 /DNA_END=1000 /DNA_ORIENTATION=-
MPSSRLPPFDNALSEDEVVVKTFVKCVEEKVDSKIILPEEEEGKIISKAILYPGAYLGSAVAIASFIGLRRIPVYLANRMNAKSSKGTPQIIKETPLAKVVGSIFDAVLAGCFGFTGWVACSDKNKILNEMAEIPLIQGKSDISDKLCGDFIAIHQDIRPQFWNEYSDDTLTAIQTFVKNCEKRKMYERRLRRDLGLGYNDNVGERSSIELPNRVPDNILEEESVNFGAADWAEMEDFDEEQQQLNSNDDDFWNGNSIDKALNTPEGYIIILLTNEV